MLPAVPMVVSTNDITNFPLSVVAYTLGIETVLIVVAAEVALPIGNVTLNPLIKRVLGVVIVQVVSPTTIPYFSPTFVYL